MKSMLHLVALGTGNSLTPQDVACVTNASDMAQFTACGVTDKMGS